MALLGLTDDSTINPHSALAGKGLPLSAGAGTAKLFKWVAQRLGIRHIDREQRDYVFPQLTDVGLIDKALILPVARARNAGKDVELGVHEPKSPNNAYVATAELARLLRVSDDHWPAAKGAFLSGDATRRRKVTERRAAVAVRRASTAPNKHATLIAAAVDALMKTVACDYELVFIDDSDGERIRDAYRQRLEELDLMPDLASKWPDAILVNETERLVWFVDAVTTDGEIDDPRARALTSWVADKGFAIGGLTTAYETWTRAAARQGSHRSLAIRSTLWIAEDGGKLLEVLPLTPNEL
jgi:hypothetical protein